MHVTHFRSRRCLAGPSCPGTPACEGSRLCSAGCRSRRSFACNLNRPDTSGRDRVARHRDCWLLRLRSADTCVSIAGGIQNTDPVIRTLGGSPREADVICTKVCPHEPQPLLAGCDERPLVPPNKGIGTEVPSGEPLSYGLN